MNCRLLKETLLLAESCKGHRRIVEGGEGVVVLFDFCRKQKCRHINHQTGLFHLPCQSIYTFQDIKGHLLFPGDHTSLTESTSTISKLDWLVPFSWIAEIKSCPASQLSFTRVYQQTTGVDNLHSPGGWRDKTDSASCTAFQDLLSLRVRPLEQVGTNQSQLS